MSRLNVRRRRPQCDLYPPHKHYCGIDLHARSMYLCILNAEGEILCIATSSRTRSVPGPSPRIATSRRRGRVHLHLVLARRPVRRGRYRLRARARAVHEGDPRRQGEERQIDAHKIAVLLRGGMLPLAYVYPKAMRATRDLLRRRNHLMRKRAELLAHIQNTASQYNLPPLGTRVDRKAERGTIPAHFPDPVVRRSIDLDLSLIATTTSCSQLEQEHALMPRRTTRRPSIGCARSRASGRSSRWSCSMRSRTLAASPRAGFLSYARLVKCPKARPAKCSATAARKSATCT